MITRYLITLVIAILVALFVYNVIGERFKGLAENTAKQIETSAEVNK